jgi:hypothetical protein
MKITTTAKLSTRTLNALENQEYVAGGVPMIERIRRAIGNGELFPGRPRNYGIKSHLEVLQWLKDIEVKGGK